MLARFCECVNEYDIDSLATYFTLDCVTGYGLGRCGLSLADAVGDRIAVCPASSGAHTLSAGKARVAFDPDRATATTYITASHEERAGRQ